MNKITLFKLFLIVVALAPRASRAESVIDRVGLALDSIFAASPQVVRANAQGTYSQCGAGTPGTATSQTVIYSRVDGHFVPTQVTPNPTQVCAKTGPRLFAFSGVLAAYDTNNRPIAAGGASLNVSMIVPVGVYGYANYLTGQYAACYVPSAVFGCVF